MDQHSDKTFAGVTAKYGVAMLVWYEVHENREDAFRRERQIKKWRRLWKLELIDKANPGWRDLAPDLLKPDTPLHPDLVEALSIPLIPAKAGTQVLELNPKPEDAHGNLGPRFRGDERE